MKLSRGLFLGLNEYMEVDGTQEGHVAASRQNGIEGQTTPSSYHRAGKGKLLACRSLCLSVPLSLSRSVLKNVDKPVSRCDLWTCLCR